MRRRSARIGPLPQAWWAVWDRRRAAARAHAIRGAIAACARTRLRCAARSARPAGGTRRRGGGRHRATAAPASGRASSRCAAQRTLRRAPRSQLRAVGRRLGRLPRAPHRLALVGGRRRRRRTAAGGLEPRRRRPRRADRQRAHGLGRRRRSEVGPVRFAEDLSRWASPGGELRFADEAARERDDNLLLFRSHYAQPFGTFSGTLPGVGECRGGRGDGAARRALVAPAGQGQVRGSASRAVCKKPLTYIVCRRLRVPFDAGRWRASNGGPWG